MRARGLVPVSVVIAAVLAPAWLMAGAMLTAQTAPAAVAPTVKTHKAAVTHKRHAKVPAKAVALPEPAPLPALPKPPDWPANDVPSPANVTWDSHGLTVVASNSSLKQILKDISVDTGTKIEGIGQDERIFGVYGPSPARDVITQLLYGSNYDILMIGDLGQGTPRQVVLTLHPGAAPPSTNAKAGKPNGEDNGAEEQAQQPDEPQPEPEPPPQEPRLGPNGFAGPGPGRTQQQLIEEMQERQRQLEQQQQEQQQHPQ
jgi:hypothetical protein